jgi:hypothetical protein
MHPIAPRKVPKPPAEHASHPTEREAWPQNSENPSATAVVLKKHRVHEPLDTRFRSAARLLQALCCKDRDQEEEIAAVPVPASKGAIRMSVSRSASSMWGSTLIALHKVIQEFGYRVNSRN